MSGEIAIRPARPEDEDSIWRILEAVIGEGDTFAWEPGTPRDRVLATWLAADGRTYVAERDGSVAGTYMLRPNQPGLGSHVANGAYAVDPHRRGAGVGRAMGVHSIAEATRLGYEAIQFNLVVATNEPALRLWRSLGFAVVGTLPGAFRLHGHEPTDAYVMYLALDAART
jgi:ribosomal protein S18 acetylase RimI-like enzyme